MVVHNGFLATNCYILGPIPTFWILNTTEHYNFCDLGELLRQVLWVLPPDVAFCDLRILESRTRGLCILAGEGRISYFVIDRGSGPRVWVFHALRRCHGRLAPVQVTYLGCAIQFTSSLTVVPVRVCGSYTHCADATVD